MNWPNDFVGKVHLGDCLSLMRQMPDGCVDLILTDPPYGVGYVTSWRSHTDPLVAKIDNDDGDWEPFAREWVAEAFRVLKADRHAYIFGSFVTYPQMRAILQPHATFKNALVWDKMNHSVGDLTGDYGRQYELVYFLHKGRMDLLGGKRHGNIIRVSLGSGAEYEHPTQKPSELMGFLIEQSTRPGDIVLDCFAGSGPVLEAAYKLGRGGVGFEIHPPYHEIASQRLSAEMSHGKLF